jgi:hypothetical protein
MMAGMNRVFSYENSTKPSYPNKELAYKKIAKEVTDFIYG